jgi:hypothetical protein
MKKLLRFIGMAVCIILFLQYRLYSSDALEGWVVDIDTGEPLENVLVTVEWNIYSPGRSIGTIKKFTITTDQKGYFYFPDWLFLVQIGFANKYPDIEFTKKDYKTENFFHNYESLLHPNFLAFWIRLDANWCNSICCCKEKTAFLKKLERQ